MATWPTCIIDNAIADIELAYGLMPYTMYKKLGLGESEPTRMSFWNLLVDFVILDMPEDSRVPIILGRPFLATARAMMMDDPNMTMEEYIKFEEEKARRHGRVFDWQTTTYGKIRVDNDLYDFRSVQISSMPSIPSPEPAICCFDDLDFFEDFENEFPAIVYNDAQTSKSDLLTKPILNHQHIDEFDDETSLPEYNEEEQNVLYFNDLFPLIIIRPDDLKSDKDNDNNEIDIIQSFEDNENMALPPREQRHIFVRYKGLEYTDSDIADFESGLERIYTREIHRVQVVDLHGMPELLRDGLFSSMAMEHRDEASVVVFTSQAWGRRFASGRNSRAYIFSWQFVARLAEHFELLIGEILGGLTVISPELQMIDMTKLVRLQICMQFDDTWAWVTIGPERQPDAAAGAPEWMARLEEDVHEIRGALTEQREVIDGMARDFSRFSTWGTTGLGRMMDRAGVTYTPYSQTYMSYQRRIR
ncbi:hypothetical protein Tco_1014155 [Tanacetum coccineum]